MWNTFVKSHRKTFDMGSYIMHYIDIGQGEPVVMVHGFSLTEYSWRNNIHALLDAGFRVILINFPGHGRTEIPSEPYSYTIENISNDIVTMTNKLGIGPFHFIGHSLGACLTLYMSFHYPQHIRKAIVIAPPAFGLPRRLLISYPGMPSVASIFFWKWKIKISSKAMYYDDSIADEELINEYFRPTRKEGYWNMLSAMLHQFFSSQFFQMLSAFHPTTMPLFIIWGEQDTSLTCDIAYKLHERIPNSRLLTVPDSGHNPHEECPELVNSTLVEFLMEHD